MKLFNLVAAFALSAAMTVVAQQIDATVSNAYVDSNGIYWVVDQNGNYLWSYDGSNWTVYEDAATAQPLDAQSDDSGPAPAPQAEIGDASAVAEDQSQQDQSQQDQSQSQSPTVVLDSQGNSWYVDANGQWYEWDGAQWQPQGQAPDTAQTQQSQSQSQSPQVVLDSQGNSWYVDANGQWYEWDGAQWQPQGQAPDTTGDVLQGGNFAASDPAPAPQQETAATCSKYNLDVCAQLAVNDFQDAAAAQAYTDSIGAYDFAGQCLALHNYARAYYGNQDGPLKWNDQLAAWATVSAAYANTLGVWDAHSYSADMGLYWGQNLYVGETSCPGAYFGWVTQEALGQGQDGNGHFLNQAGLVFGNAGDYNSVGCGAYGNTIVCNLGLADDLVTVSLASLPDVNTAMANALNGVYSL